MWREECKRERKGRKKKGTEEVEEVEGNKSRERYYAKKKKK